MKQNNRYLSWLNQARSDLVWGRDSLKSGHYAQTCFVAQQVGEKALKALAFLRGNDIVKSHSLVKISHELGINGEIKKAANRLDLYYISTRYPDSLPDSGVPSEYFDKEQATEALDMASMIIDKIEKEIDE